MKNRIICKTLAVAVILLFIGLGIQPAFAVKSDSSDSKGGPDLKIIKIFISQNSGLHQDFATIECVVENIGDDFDGDYTYEGKMWRRSIFGETNLHFRTQNEFWGELGRQVKEDIDIFSLICFGGILLVFIEYG